MARRPRCCLLCLVIIAAVSPQPGSGAYAAEQRKVNDIVVVIRVGIPRREAHAIRKLDDCLDRAVAGLADQRETAQAVADAALVLCEPQEVDYLISTGETVTLEHIEVVKDTHRPQVAARVMTVRADRAKRR